MLKHEPPNREKIFHICMCVGSQTMECIQGVRLRYFATVDFPNNMEPTSQFANLSRDSPIRGVEYL